MDGFELLGLRLEAEERCRVADVAEEEEGGDGGDQEEDGDDLVEVLGCPCGEIERFRFGESIRVDCGQGSVAAVAVVGFGGFWVWTILDQH